MRDRCIGFQRINKFAFYGATAKSTSYWAKRSGESEVNFARVTPLLVCITRERVSYTPSQCKYNLYRHTVWLIFDAIPLEKTHTLLRASAEVSSCWISIGRLAVRLHWTPWHF